MKKIIVLLTCLMLSMPLMAQIEDLQIGDEIRWINVEGFKGWELYLYETEQEKYEKEQLWKYTKFVFFTSMFVAGWNTRTDYGIIAGTGFLYFALNIEF